MLLNHLELWQFNFFQEIFPKNKQTIIYLYCFSRYQKYLCKIFSLWIYPIYILHIFYTVNIISQALKRRIERWYTFQSPTLFGGTVYDIRLLFIIVKNWIIHASLGITDKIQSHYCKCSSLTRVLKMVDKKRNSSKLWQNWLSIQWCKLLKISKISTCLLCFYKKWNWRNVVKYTQLFVKCIYTEVRS